MAHVFVGWRRLLLSLALLFPLAAPAHEVLPSIADMTATDGTVTFDLRTNLEGLVAGIDLTATADTNASAQAMQYDALRALPPDALADRFRAFWPAMSQRIHVQVDGRDLPLALVAVIVPDVGDVALTRTSTVTFTAALPPGAKSVQVGWASQFGALVLRQMGVQDPYDGYLEAGTFSTPIRLSGGDRMSPMQAFLSYVPVGFDHIVPQGLDHILFVLGLFFLSTRLSPLLWQVSAFTLAHTVTLGLGALGYVNVPASIVEPIIAASITFVAVENILTKGLSRWRPLVVFGFGLLHGLGFAAVLGEFGLPDEGFFPALIGFNLGVELGQLFVIAAAFAAVGWFWRKSWYRAMISVPASAAIAAAGAFWFVQRVTGWGG
ncbi:MAG: hypothetical protein RIT14_2886 [Pseudomonadota bacterium]|jgi:hypothetical protein